MFPGVFLALSRLPLKHGACRTSDDGSSHGRIFLSELVGMRLTAELTSLVA